MRRSSDGGEDGHGGLVHRPRLISLCAQVVAVQAATPPADGRARRGTGGCPADGRRGLQVPGRTEGGEPSSPPSCRVRSPLPTRGPSASTPVAGRRRWLKCRGAPGLHGGTQVPCAGEGEDGTNARHVLEDVAPADRVGDGAGGSRHAPRHRHASRCHRAPGHRHASRCHGAPGHRHASRCHGRAYGDIRWLYLHLVSP